MWSWLLGNSSSTGSARGGRFGSFLHARREFTLANMQHIHHQLLRYPELPDAEIVELLRVLSEFLIYSDQNRTDASGAGSTIGSPPAAVDFAASASTAGIFFDYFCEKNILALLLQLGESAPRVAVQIQLLQTLSILVQNIATRTSLYYLLSNNYVNKLLECPFAYDRDDDVRDWFVTLLKALSLRLNEDTVQFFFDAEHNSFPLYAQALRFGRCGETMIKVAVKTLMLNVLKVEDDRVRRFLLEYQKMAYFADVVETANEMALKIQGLLNIWTPTASAVTEKLEEAIDAYMDHCYYLQDMLDVNLPELCYKIGELLFTRHVQHLLAVSLLPNCNPPPQRVSTRLALYLLTRMLGIFEHTPLVNAIAFLYVLLLLSMGGLFHP
jgi:protein CLEC16A